MNLPSLLQEYSFSPSLQYPGWILSSDSDGAICDVGAYAPRNYAAERLGAPRREEDLYIRFENNGWRFAEIISYPVFAGAEALLRTGSIDTMGIHVDVSGNTFTETPLSIQIQYAEVLELRGVVSVMILRYDRIIFFS